MVGIQWNISENRIALIWKSDLSWFWIVCLHSGCRCAYVYVALVYVTWRNRYSESDFRCRSSLSGPTSCREEDGSKLWTMVRSRHFNLVGDASNAILSLFWIDSAGAGADYWPKWVVFDEIPLPVRCMGIINHGEIYFSHIAFWKRKNTKIEI